MSEQGSPACQDNSPRAMLSLTLPHVFGDQDRPRLRSPVTSRTPAELSTDNSFCAVGRGQAWLSLWEQRGFPSWGLGAPRAGSAVGGGPGSRRPELRPANLGTRFPSKALSMAQQGLWPDANPGVAGTASNDFQGFSISMVIKGNFI